MFTKTLLYTDVAAHFTNSDTFTSVAQSNNTHTQAQINLVVELAVSDYVDVDWGLATTAVNFYSDNHRVYFSGYLLG